MKEIEGEEGGEKILDVWIEMIASSLIDIN